MFPRDVGWSAPEVASPWWTGRTAASIDGEARGMWSLYEDIRKATGVAAADPDTPDLDDPADAISSDEEEGMPDEDDALESEQALDGALDY